MELTAAETDDDSVEKLILAVFLRRWSEMQCEIVSVTYLLKNMNLQITLFVSDVLSTRFFELKMTISGSGCTGFWFVS